MKLERTKNAKRNLIYGMVNKVVVMGFPFILRTIMIYFMGIEYVGLNTLCSSILGILSLAELGFGSAMVYSMYEPIAKNDTETICALLKYYRQCYHIIGSVIFVGGLLIMPFVKYLIKSDMPEDISIYAIYFVSLCSTSITYFLYGYKTSLLCAHQRDDVSLKNNTILLMIRYCIEIALLLLFRNYYLYMIVAPIFNVINNLVLARIINKMYPYYVPKGDIAPKQKRNITNKLKSLFMYKLGNIAANNVDTIIISSYLGIRILGQYQNYYLIITTLFGFFQLVYSAVQAGIGNMIVTEEKKVVYKFFNIMFIAQAFAVGWCTVCLLCLYQPFIEIWAGKKNVLSFDIVILFCIYFFIWKVQDIVYIFKDAGGMWEFDKFRPLLSGILNLFLSLFLVNFYGLYGIILATIIINLIINLFWGAWVLFHYYFKQPVMGYLIKLLKYSCITIIVCIITYIVCSYIKEITIISFFYKCGICLVLPTSLFCIIYRKEEGYKEAKQKVINLLNS